MDYSLTDHLDNTSVVSLSTWSRHTGRGRSLAAAGGAGKQEVTPEAEGDVCGSAGNMTTVRAIDAPYTYSSQQRRRALRKQAEKCDQSSVS